MPAAALLPTLVWNFLGGLDWAGLPWAIELYGVRDVESLVHGLIEIRDAMENR